MNRPTNAENPTPPQPAVPPQQPLPKPIVRRSRWPFPAVWLVPVAALIGAGYFIHDRHKDDGPEVTVKLDDATGLRPGDSPVTYRGVQVGAVSGLDVSPDHHSIDVKLRLHKNAQDFAKSGATFWVVRPEISIESVSGLGTVLTGPYIEARPGDGKPVKEFDGLAKPPPTPEEGLTITLRTPNLDRLQVDSPVYYRGVPVGSIRDVRIAADASHVDLSVFIRHRYAPVVRTNSHFWAVAAADVKAGLFQGVQVKLGSLRTLLSGGIAFATPDDGIGPPAHEGDSFPLHDEPKKEWLTWTPRIDLAPDPNPNAEGQ